ncbi:MAG: UbiA family prenyltransferase [Methanocellales archaeon]|nr:UbiA family prenyltransferase [Methanocellales archaeon]
MEPSLIDIGFGVAGPTGKGLKAKILAILCVHRVLWLPWGALCAGTGALLFMALGAPILPLWKLILGLFAAGLFTRVISQADMLYDWWTGEDEKLGPPNSTLPLVTGLLSPKTVIFFMTVETIFCLWVALFIFNPTCFLVAILMLIWGVTYSATPPLKKLRELQRRIYRSLSGLIVLGGIAMVAPGRILSWEAFVISLAVIIGCLAYHDKDSMRFTPLTPKGTISFTVVMSIFEYLWLIVLWQTFALSWAFLMLYFGLAIFKIRALFHTYAHSDEHKAHIKLTHVGVINYTIMLVIINIAAAYNILISI